MKFLKLIFFMCIALLSNSKNNVYAAELDFGYKSWQPIVTGDTIYIIAPSHSFPNEESQRATLSFLEDFLLSRFGIRIKYDATAFKNIDPLCPEKAMSTEAAYQDLKTAFNDPEVKAIWAIRGGRLSLELWSLLEAEAKNFPAKPILGFSDTTSLHLFFNNAGFATIHSPVLSFFKESPTPAVNKLTSLESTFDILMGKNPLVTYKGIVAQNESAEKSIGTINGKLFGGNLSSLHYYDSVYGAPSSPAIWMIETIDDYTRIESILEALLHGSIFKTAQAIIFGSLHGKSFSDLDFIAVQKRCNDIIKRFAKKTTIPVFSVIAQNENTSFSFGHGDLNYPFPLGTDAVLKINQDGEENTLFISAS